MKKKITKMVTMAMAALIMTGFLAGCQKREIPMGEPLEDAAESREPLAEAAQEKPGPEDGAHLVFWTSYVEFGKAAAAAFEAETGVPVEVEEFGLDSIAKMSLAGPAGEGADVFMATHNGFDTGYGAGLFLEFDDEAGKRIAEVMNPAAMETVTRDGRVYGVPVAVDTIAMFYNKDLTGDEPAGTLEQIMEEAAEYNNAAENKFWYLMTPSSGYSSYCFLSSQGFSLFGPDGKNNDDPGFDDPEFVKGLELIRDLKELMPIHSEDLKNSQFLSQSFLDGKTAYYPDGTWFLPTVKESGINYGVTVLPTYGGNALKPFAGVKNAHVSAFTDYPAAAQLFAEYLAGEECAAVLYEKEFQVTARADVSGVEGLSGDEDMLAFVEQMNQAVPMPGVTRINYYWTLADGILTSVFEGDLTPEEAARKAQDDFDALVQSE